MGVRVNPAVWRFPGKIMVTQPSEGKKMAVLSKTYLAAYNGVQAVGWGYILIQSVSHLLLNKSPVGLWNSHGTSLLIFQSLAALEVLHCFVGLVPSNYIVTGMQVFSRLFQAWAILFSVKEIQNAPTVPVVLLAWGLTETVRYSYYFANLISESPRFLTWCRYSLFLGLYPMGVFGEVGNIILALGPIKQRQIYSLLLPNRVNFSFSFYYANIFLVLSYIPLFPKLFNHMRKQRAKVLGRPSAHPSSSVYHKEESKMH